MPHDMPQYLIVFAVSSTLETSNFEMFAGFGNPAPPHPLENFYLFYLCTQVVKIKIIKYFDDNK